MKSPTSMNSANTFNLKLNPIFQMKEKHKFVFD